MEALQGCIPWDGEGAVCQNFVAFILRLVACCGVQVDVASNVVTGLEVWLDRFGRHLTTIDVDGQEVNAVILGMEGFF